MRSLHTPVSVPLCPPGTQPAGTLAVFSANAVPPVQRPKYWLGDVLRRLDNAAGPDLTGPFRALLTRVGGEGAELLEHSGSSLLAQRSAARCRADQCDDIVIDFIVTASRASVSHGGVRLLPRAGDMVVMDLGQPIELVHASHRIISLFLPRARVRAMGADPSRLAGRLLPRRGMAALLRSHMRMTMDQAVHLQPAHRIAAVTAAVDMALSVFHAEIPGAEDTKTIGRGLYAAARILIDRDCTNLALTPLLIAQELGCSRAGLYRAFAQQSENVAEMIWAARLAHARTMLRSDSYRHLLVSEIAFRSGFSGHATFDQMFRRTYGMTPREMRRTTTAAPARQKALRD